MALKLEDLKIGETYTCFNAQDNTVLFIGKTSVFYNFDNNEKKEGCTNIDHVLKTWSLKTKPKKVIELVGFLNETGYFSECLGGSIDYDFRTSGSIYTRISSRTVECE